MNSSSYNVTSGVPQGSVLGPVLFLIYVNDIGLNIHSEIRLFADDILLYQPIRTPDNHLQLQEDLNTLTKWASDWKMTFNIPKCKIIQFTTHHNKSKHLYTMSETPLEAVWKNTTILESDCIINSLGALMLTISVTKRTILTNNLCYHRLIIVWDPYTKNDTGISKLEMLQHQAARFIMNKPWYRKCHNVSITKILAELHWPTLQSRRKQARLILMFKIVNGNLIVPACCLPLSPTLSCTRANHSLK